MKTSGDYSMTNTDNRKRASSSAAFFRQEELVASYSPGEDGIKGYYRYSNSTPRPNVLVTFDSNGRKRELNQNQETIEKPRETIETIKIPIVEGREFSDILEEAGFDDEDTDGKEANGKSKHNDKKSAASKKQSTDDKKDEKGKKDKEGKKKVRV